MGVELQELVAVDLASWQGQQARDRETLPLEALVRPGPKAFQDLAEGKVCEDRTVDRIGREGGDRARSGSTGRGDGLEGGGGGSSESWPLTERSTTASPER
jgi:hypothetical protein